ncbi:flavin reductase [Faecalicatena fissicatena]|uniref:Flavin reductase family protein n=1 Tax=Faecalicatena fissicatena TaxID=290055 RepID=A0ABS2E6I4_9FIRM|nr:flavin reductase family protein [Faecalicatena fissicatena]HIX99002.1 flavin reductase family protein [Candidatus Dorea intestinigallinarum]
MVFKEISINELSFQPFQKMSGDWMLITAGDESGNNTMTASWGLFGVLWRKNIAEIFIRPQRYTKKFVDQEDLITLSFLPEQYKTALKICGTLSGKNVDKWKASGLHPYYIDRTTAVAEAELILIGKKQYAQWIDPQLFLERTNDERCYPQKDYHQMYMLEIVKVLKAEQ